MRRLSKRWNSPLPLLRGWRPRTILGHAGWKTRNVPSIRNEKGPRFKVAAPLGVPGGVSIPRGGETRPPRNHRRTQAIQPRAAPGRLGSWRLAGPASCSDLSGAPQSARLIWAQAGCPKLELRAFQNSRFPPASETRNSKQKSGFLRRERLSRTPFFLFLINFMVSFRGSDLRSERSSFALNACLFFAPSIRSYSDPTPGISECPWLCPFL